MMRGDVSRIMKVRPGGERVRHALLKISRRPASADFQILIPWIVGGTMIHP